MPVRETLAEITSPEMPDYLGQLHDMALDEGIPEGVISERGYGLAADLLKIMWRDHGDPESDSYKPYHNDGHGLNVVLRSWRLWKPLHDELPDRFDTGAFELLMIAAAGHDIVNDPDAAKNYPGQNEVDSAVTVCRMMIDAGYDDAEAHRVYDAIIKTSVARDEHGVITQTYMREGSTDIMGLILGQADMNGILLEGPSTLFDDAYAIWLEMTETPVKDALHSPVGVVNFMLDEEKYLNDRVEALSEDLLYYVDDPEEREAIVQIYWDEFRGPSLRALQTARLLRSAPDRTRSMVDESFGFASRIAQRGLEQISAVKGHLVGQVKPGSETK